MMCEQLKSISNTKNREKEEHPKLETYQLHFDGAETKKKSNQ